MALDGGGQASVLHRPPDLVPAPGGAESDNSEMATVAVDGGSQASRTYGPLPDPQIRIGTLLVQRVRPGRKSAFRTGPAKYGKSFDAEIP